MSIDNKQEKSKSIRFPIRMFMTAAVFSCFMVLLISTTFSQVNSPCIHSHSASLSLVVDTTSSSQQAQQNTQQQEPLAMCNRNNQQISWATWLFKQSDSAEFHYLDLLELLSRK